MIPQRTTPNRWLWYYLAGAFFAGPAAALFAAATSRAADAQPGPVMPGHHREFALRELDCFLDHHPLIEDDLRRDPQLVASEPYLSANPALRRLLAENPGITPAVATNRRYYLHRALLLQAALPLRGADLAALDSYFEQEPEVEQALNTDPSAIRTEAFLHGHPGLRDFLAGHPALRRAFFPTPVLERLTNPPQAR